MSSQFDCASVSDFFEPAIKIWVNEKVSVEQFIDVDNVTYIVDILSLGFKYHI